MYGQSEQPAGGQGFVVGGFPIDAAGVQMVMNTGRQVAEGWFARLINIRELRRYFAVSTDYVLNKLKLLLFPYTYRGTWQRSVLQFKNERGDTYPPPRADINAPDLYIPLMGLITYIIFCAMVAGFSGGFKPEILGIVASKAFVFFAADVGVLYLGFYLLGKVAQPILDCVAMCGYVFVGVALNELAQMIGGKWLLYPCLLFTCAGFSYFLMHTVRVILLSDPTPAPVFASNPAYTDPSYGMNQGSEGTIDPAMREQNIRRYYLVFLAFVQLVLMFFLAFTPSFVSVANPMNQNINQNINQIVNQQIPQQVQNLNPSI